MAPGFTFSFNEGDMEEDAPQLSATTDSLLTDAERPISASAGAFPVAGKPQLPAIRHDLDHMLAQLPSKVAYSLIEVDRGLQLPRRELWDVKVQVMAEQEVDAELEPGLGTHDVKTGIYEGGFKSWESSVDLVKELVKMSPLEKAMASDRALRVVELGCGTALPSLSLFQTAVSCSMRGKTAVFLTAADYNPTVLQLVTLPNFILSWALATRASNPLVEQALETDGELELTEAIIRSFKDSLSLANVSLNFISGGWSEEFVNLLYDSELSLQRAGEDDVLLLAAETIYSPFALDAFTETLLSILRNERRRQTPSKASAIVGAKRHYFGVGGSLDDFVEKAEGCNCKVDWLREEGQGVRRGVVRCELQ